VFHPAYRSPTFVEARHAELSNMRQRLMPVASPLRRVYAARWSRTVSGALGIAAATAMAALSFAGACAEGEASASYRSASVTTLVWALPLMAVTLLATRLLVAAMTPAMGAISPESLRYTDPARALAAMEANHPYRALHARLSGLELPSLALPMIAACLLLPLTLHWLVANTHDAAADFGTWIQTSLAIVGHVHLVLAALVLLRVRQYRAMSLDELTHGPSGWVRAWGISILAAAVPGAILLLVPPLLTAFTGLAFLPPLFLGMRAIYRREREVVERAAELALHGRPDVAAASALS
jgi:hypothetical protein